jgi:single-stranded-DNA-specific exonuclease
MSYQSVTGKNWELNEFNSNEVLEYSQKKGFSSLLSKLLSIRKITIDKSDLFLDPKIKDFLPNPNVLKDMELASNLLINAILNKKKICVFGDYDVDGASATAIIINFLKNFYDNYIIYIPDRITEGYGPTLEAFKKIINDGINFIITVDCGTTSFEAIDYAYNNNTEVIILDHHQADISIPKCKALVNPKQINDSSNLNYLCAAGVAFLFIVSTNKILREKKYYTENNIKEPELLDFLDLVALGTVCDVVPLLQLNRALVYQGLKILKKRKNIGIKTLFDLLNVSEAPNAYQLGFVIGPRINAGGRIGKSNLGSLLLTTEDAKTAYQIANQLNELNVKRKSIEENILKEAFALAETEKNNDVIIVSSKLWHEGLIGIIASRIKEKYSKPTIVITETNIIAKGSCRSIVGFDIGLNIVLAKQNNLILKGGGHVMAAGFSINKNKISEFKNFIFQSYSKTKKNININLDMNIDEIITANSVNEKTFEEIDKLAPFGSGNPEPRFMIENLTPLKINFENENLIKYLFKDNSNIYLTALCFKNNKENIIDYLKNLKNNKFNIIGRINKNVWNKQKTFEFLIDDLCLVS